MFSKMIFKLNVEHCLIDRNLDCIHTFPNHSEKCIENRTQFHSCVGISCTCMILGIDHLYWVPEDCFSDSSGISIFFLSVSNLERPVLT